MSNVKSTTQEFYENFLDEDKAWVPETADESFKNVLNILEEKGAKFRDSPYWSKEEYESLIKRDINAAEFIDEFLSNVGETDIYYKVLPEGSTAYEGGDINRPAYRHVDNAADTLYAFEHKLKEHLGAEWPHAFQYANLNPEERKQYKSQNIEVFKNALVEEMSNPNSKYYVEDEKKRNTFAKYTAQGIGTKGDYRKKLYDKLTYHAEGHVEEEAHEDLQPIVDSFLHSGKVTKKYAPLTYVNEDGDVVEGTFPVAESSSGADISAEDKQKFIDEIYQKMDTVKKIKGEEWWKDNKDLILRSPKYFNYIVSGEKEAFAKEIYGEKYVEPDNTSVLQPEEEDPNFLGKVWNYIKGG